MVPKSSHQMCVEDPCPKASSAIPSFVIEGAIEWEESLIEIPNE